MEDITKTGPIGLKGLSGINSQGNDDYFANLMKLSGKQTRELFTPEASENIGIELGEAGYGQSSFDSSIQNLSQLDKINDVRGQKQAWYEQLGAGLGKGVSLAATTFLDGTLGFAYGLGSAAIHGDVSKIWDNEVSNGLQWWNEQMESYLPNYRTEEEQNNAWYQNLGTMNFWADSFLKNIGFTVGAFYSGNAWTKGLKSLGAINNAIGAQVAGSMLSAINEGRIEANNNSDDWEKLELEKLQDSYKQRYDEIMATPDTLINVGTEDSPQYVSKKYSELEALKDNLEAEKKSIQDRKAKMGLTDLIGNTILLSLDNFYTFGKLYARGFKNARDKAATRVGKLEQASKEIAQEEAGKRIKKEGTEYTYDTITKGEAVRRGLGRGLVEGQEEMTQQWIANTSGNLQTYDSPDAYYTALLDSDAERQTKDFITSATQGFIDSYGNGDQWEQFAIGALTGLLGTPTFGSVQNSDANTWLGRGKKVGISGGLFGELGEANRQNKEGQEAVDYMNKYMSKLQDRERYFVQSQSFTNAMDGWAEEGNAFEYKNAEDNDDFAAISRFAKVGRLGDLKDMVKQDFNTISDEELEKIANFTTEEDNTRGGWRNPDGSLMSDSEEGRDFMRQELSKKRDKILSEIDNYEKSVEEVRAIGNNSLDEDQVNELAWLNWKIGRFDERFANIKEENSELFTSLSNGILNFKDAIDEKSEEGKKWLNVTNNLNNFISYLQGAKTSLDLAARIATNPKPMEALSSEETFDYFADNSGLSYANYKAAMDNLKDAAKIATAAKQFNDRYKEFTQDPIKLIKNREEIFTKKANVSKAKNDVSAREKIEEAEVSDLVKAAREEELDLEQAMGLFTDEDTEFMKGAKEELAKKKSVGATKVEQATKIVNTSDRLTESGGIIDEIGELDSSITPQAIQDAKKLVKAAEAVSQDEQELLDIAREVYNNPNILFDEGDSTLATMQQNPAELQETLNNRWENAVHVLGQALVKKRYNDRQMDSMPKSSVTESEPAKEVGHDATEKGIPINKEEPKSETPKEIFAKEANLEESNDKDIQDTTRVLNDITSMVFAGASLDEVANTVGKTEAYKRVTASNPKMAEYFAEFASNLKSNSEKNEPEIWDTTESEEPITPSISAEDIVSSSSIQMNQDVNSLDKQEPIHMYWRPATSELPYHPIKGDTTPYYVIAKTVDSHKYTPQQIQRMEAVYKYLEEHKAFQIVNSGEVQPNDEVRFFIDESLNQAAGELVVLMIDSKGRVIGDLVSSQCPGFVRQQGLADFVNRVEKEWKDAGSPSTFTSKESTTVAKNLVGKVPYTADGTPMNTLNDIHQNTSFKLGVALTSGSNARIAASAGRRKSQGQSSLERTIMSPINAKAGQPYLLMPTSDARRKYMPVPFIMPAFTEETSKSALGDAVMTVLGKLQWLRPSSIMDIKRELQELLAIPEIHINLSNNGILKIDIKPTESSPQITIFRGNSQEFGIHNEIAKGLFGIPFQVSRKYVNDTYNGKDYNRMIGELASTNLPIGGTHTVNEWFTLHPLGSNGEQLKAKSPKSTGQNPNQATPNTRLVSYTNGDSTIMLSVDTKTFEVTDPSTGKVYEGKKADAVKAEVWGYVNNAPSDKPYNTKWGWFNPITKTFVEEPKKVVAVLGADIADLTGQAKKKGLLNNAVRKALWEVLTPEQQSTIVNKKGPKQEQWMSSLERAFNTNSKNFDTTKLKGSVNDFLGRKGLYREASEDIEVWDKDKELSWIKQALPNLSSEEQLRIVDGLIKIPNKDSFAWGQFKQGIIYISNVAANGTVYHEAFHAVTHTLLSEQEQEEMFKEARGIYGNINELSLEENLAEDFRRYMQLEDTPIVGKLLKLFRTLKHLVQQLLGNESYLDGLFYRINRGKLANRIPSNTSISRNRSIVEEIQGTLDSSVNNPRVFPRGAKSVAANTKLGTILDGYKKRGIEVRVRFDNALKKWKVVSTNDTNKSYYRELEQYHRDKLAYGNLSQEDKNYLSERGIDTATYIKMTQLEKEILFKCRY